MTKVRLRLSVLGLCSLFFSVTSPACDGDADDPTSSAAGVASAGAGGNAGEGGAAGSGAPGGAGTTAGSSAGGSAGSAASGTAGSSSDADRFATSVVSFTPGAHAGYGQDEMPGVVLGPPVGGGTSQGSLDVLSLGVGGEIVLALGVDAVDGPGPDLIVFENAFYEGGDPDVPFAELGEVSVSEDGQTWSVFPCDPSAYKTSSCAGWRPVFSSPDDGISPLDPSVSGGDPFDLADLGVARARFVKIRDLSVGGGPPSAGFDLDAIAVVNTDPP